MLQNNFTTELLDLKDVTVTNCSIHDAYITIDIEYKARPHECPECGYVTSIVHDYRMQRVKDTPIQGKFTVFNYRKRRYRCPACGKRFFEQQPLVPKYHRLSSRFAYYLLTLLKEKRSMKDIANCNDISSAKVLSMLKLLSYEKPKSLPAVLSIDEFRGNTGDKKFQCILTDPVHKRIVDILPGRESHYITDYLKTFNNRDKVQFFVMDMNKAYLDIAKAFFPKATIIIDRFHVARYNTWAFENIRRREQARLDPSLRKYFKRSRRLLLCRMNSLSDENKQAVHVMLGLAPGLADAYLLKEKFYFFMDAQDSQEARRRLKEFFIFAKQLNMSEYEPCVRMLTNWKEYILNSFDYRYSNGYTEGINNKIKVIKRVAFGFRNFENFRKRIFLAMTQAV